MKSEISGPEINNFAPTVIRAMTLLELRLIMTKVYGRTDEWVSSKNEVKDETRISAVKIFGSRNYLR